MTFIPIALCVFINVILSEAGGENEGGGSKSTFEVGATALAEYPLQVTTLLIGVITVAVIAELVVEHVKHRINNAFRNIVDAVTNEVMILGVVSIFLFLLEDTKAWEDARIDGEPVDLHVLHFIHMALFLVALFYIFSNISLIVLMRRTADRWASYEAFCVEDEMTMSNNIKEHQTSRKSFEKVNSMNSEPDIAQILRNSDIDLMSSSFREVLVDMDTRLKVYTDWRNSASLWDLLKNLPKVKAGIELKRAVQFRHIRSFFLSQGRRRNSIQDIEHILHNRFKFSNFLYRCAVQDLNKCSSIGIKVWIFLGFLIGIDALRIEIAILISEHGYHHEFHPNPLHDIFYWISIQYAVLIFLIFMSMMVKKAWGVFKRQNETAVRISQKLRHSVADKTIREIVRKKMLEKEIRIIKAEEFQKLFLFSSPEMTFTFIKIGVMVCCWTLMLYILGYSKKIWDPEFLHPGQAFILSVAYIAPIVIIFWFIIPETLGIMSILMSARDLSLATPEEKKTLVELMRISMSEELTLFKVQKRKRNSNSIARASDETMVPREAILPGVKSLSNADETSTQNSSQTAQHKPFTCGVPCSIDAANENGSISEPYSPTAILYKTRQTDQLTTSELKNFLPSSLPAAKHSKTMPSDSRPSSLAGGHESHQPSSPAGTHMAGMDSMRHRGSMGSLSKAKSFLRDHMLSETEAVVERIRHNEVESDDEEEMEREWEKRRRTAAFARYGELPKQIVSDMELSYLPKMRERSLSRGIVCSSPTPLNTSSSPYTNMQFVEEGDEGDYSDPEGELTSVVKDNNYGSIPGEYSELRNIEVGIASKQNGIAAMFRRVSEPEDPAMHYGHQIDTETAQRIVRENKLDHLRLFDAGESKVQI